eukprot:scaffold106882_cov28-Tisochrysis_lutea.AAC.1
MVSSPNTHVTPCPPFVGVADLKGIPRSSVPSGSDATRAACSAPGRRAEGDGRHSSCARAPSGAACPPVRHRRPAGQARLRHSRAAALRRLLAAARSEPHRQWQRTGGPGGWRARAPALAPPARHLRSLRAA